MPAFSLKEKYESIIKPWIFAIGICLIAHFLFFILFSPISSDKKEIPSNHPVIAMLPLGNTNIPYPLRGIISWIQDEDPTLIVLPNLNYGFSEILLSNENIQSQKPAFSISDYSKFLINVDISQPEVNPSNIPVRDLPLSDYLSKLTWLDSASPPTVSQNHFAVKKISYPYITDFYTGQPIDVKLFGLSDNNEEIMRFNPQGATIIELYISQDSSLILSGRIVESCGSPELDEIALRNLYVCNLPDEVYSNFKNNFFYARVEWLSVYSSNKYKVQGK